MVDRCMRTDYSHCDPSRITLDLRSRVIQLGLQLKESFLTHLSTIRFSLIKLKQNGPCIVVVDYGEIATPARSRWSDIVHS